MNDDEADRIPICGYYRNVPMHDRQDEARLAVVRREIDAVLDLSGLKLLVEICPDQRWSPEARLLAAARLKAMHQIAAEDRRVRPSVDLAYVGACVAGLDSVQWRSRWSYSSSLDPGTAPGAEGPVRRDTPLQEHQKPRSMRRDAVAKGPAT